MTFFVLLAVGLIFATTSVNSVHQITIANSTTNKCVSSDFTINFCNFYTNDICYLTRGNAVVFKFYYEAQFNPVQPKINVYSINDEGATTFTHIDGYLDKYTPEVFIGYSKTLFSVIFRVMPNFPTGVQTMVMKIYDDRSIVNVCKFDFKLGIL